MTPLVALPSTNGQGHKYGIAKHLEKEDDTVSGGEIVSASGAGTTTANGQSSFLYYYHPDHLGSTGFVTDGNGKLYEHMEYFPFGETWVDEHSNTLRTPYLFTGKEFDQETGLYYFGARYYDRWITSMFPYTLRTATITDALLVQIVIFI